jgi:GH18 family chitinase
MAIDNGAIKKWNHEQVSASIQINDTWIGYDDELALQMKVKYASKNCLGGIMIWVRISICF